jgi:hypothetical protein
VASRRRISSSEVARALWLLGLVPPVGVAELSRAWRERVALTHPDRFGDDPRKAGAAELLTRALNDARTIVREWQERGEAWPEPARGRAAARPAAAPRAEEPAEPASICDVTGLRRGDQVRVYPYDGEPEAVAGTEEDGPRTVRVFLGGGGSEPSTRVRLAAFSCPVCGSCAGPHIADPSIRPCPDCLLDLRLLTRRASEAPRIRRAIEGRAETGIAAARTIGDVRLEDRATHRRRWARRLALADREALHAELLSAFGHAYERWSESSRAGVGVG